MRKSLTKVISTVLLTGIIGVASAYATPSTHIWAPSTDIQPYKVVHLTHDVYAPVSKDGADNYVPPVINLGLEAGVLPYKNINLEVGFDIIQNGINPKNDADTTNNSLAVGDANPLYLNWKLGTPENGLMNGFPALAVGTYLMGTKGDVTDYNVMYAKAAKTFGNIGKVSLGYYTGNDELLFDETGVEKANDGILLCWEKTVTEISDKLWVAVDYMGGDSFLGTLNVGFAWAFTPNVSVIFGYDMLNNQDLTGAADTFTTQLDINF